MDGAESLSRFAAASAIGTKVREPILLRPRDALTAPIHDELHRLPASHGQMAEAMTASRPFRGLQIEPADQRWCEVDALNLMECMERDSTASGLYRRGAHLQLLEYASESIQSLNSTEENCTHRGLDVEANRVSRGVRADGRKMVDADSDMASWCLTRRCCRHGRP